MNTALQRFHEILHCVCAVYQHISWMLHVCMQAFGMMGWRLGYIAYPNAELASDPELGFQMLKVQDTIPICVAQMSQVAGLGALQAGSPWVRQQVQGLSCNRSGYLGRAQFPD